MRRPRPLDREEPGRLRTARPVRVAAPRTVLAGTHRHPALTAPPGGPPATYGPARRHSTAPGRSYPLDQLRYVGAGCDSVVADSVVEASTATATERRGTAWHGSSPYHGRSRMCSSRPLTPSALSSRARC